MLKYGKICFRITKRRLVGAILAAASMVNVFIVGAVFMSEPSAPSMVERIPDPSLTPLQPTQESNPTPSSTSIPIETHTPTATLTATHTPSPTPQPTGTFTTTATACSPWTFWAVYIVQAGDTLFALAGETGTTVPELLAANCLVSDRIYVGQRLYVPRLPIPTPTGTPAVRPRACAEFEDLEPGLNYYAGQTLSTSGLNVTVGLFALENGAVVRTGYVSGSRQQLPGGYGSQLLVDNAILVFDLGSEPTRLSFLFGEYGGNLNLHVNGDFRNFEDFADLDGRIVGGAKVDVLNGYGNDSGYFQLAGEIRTFAVGGQELWIDNLCLTP